MPRRQVDQTRPKIPGEPFLDRAGAAKHFGRSTSWLDDQLAGPHPPPSYDLGGRPGFLASELTEWAVSGGPSNKTRAAARAKAFRDRQRDAAARDALMAEEPQKRRGRAS